MRLEIIIRTLKRNFRYIVLSAVVGGVLGILVFYFFPFGYTATGSLFVGRRPDLIQREEFTYEGYYAQKAASDYTNTIVGILESPSLASKVLQKQNLIVNEENLRELSKNTDIRTKAPQLVFVRVKAETKNEAEQLWNIVVDEVITTSNNLNRIEGDPNLSVQKVSEPVVTEVYKDILIFSFVGFLIGAFFSTLVVFGKSELFVRI